MSKILVAYFSAGGVTARAAQEMAAAIGADLYEIAPAEPYTAADLDWTDKKSRSTREMTDPASRPSLGGPLPDLSGYDTVFVAFPSGGAWSPGRWDTFLDGGNFAGKRMIPFATSGGSGIAHAEGHLRQMYPGLDWSAGRLVNRGRGGLGQVRGKGVSLPCRGVRKN